MTGPRYRHANGASDLHSAPRRWRRGWGTSFGGGGRCVPSPGRLIGRSAPETDPAASGRGRLLDCQPPPTGRLLDCQLPPTGKGRGALGGSLAVAHRRAPLATRRGPAQVGKDDGHPTPPASCAEATIFALDAAEDAHDRTPRREWRVGPKNSTTRTRMPATRREWVWGKKTQQSNRCDGTRGPRRRRGHLRRAALKHRRCAPL